MPETKAKAGLGSLVVRPLLAGMVAAGAVAPIAAPAADDVFLKIDGIQGESNDDIHKNEIVLLSYSQSFANPVTNGATAGRVNCGDVRVTKLIDRSSPALIGGVATGTHFKNAVITFRKAGGKEQIEYYKVTLTEVLLDAITQSDASNDSATILEQLSMSAAKFLFEYKQLKIDGSVGATIKFGWDCVRNKKL